MIEFGLKSNFSKVATQVAKLGDQTPFATSLAMNRSAKYAQAGLKAAMQREFDRPTPYVLNSLYTKNSTKKDLNLVIGHKPGGGSGTPSSRIVKAEIEGGARSYKSAEKALGHYVMPSKYAPLDRYGNVSGSTMRSIISAVTQGPRPQKVVRGQARAPSTKRKYFVVYEGEGKAPGVYMRGTNGGFIPVLFFSRAPVYKARYDLEGVVWRIFTSEYSRQFPIAMDEALRTARVKL
jgi:hypothetical protein